MRFIYVPLVIMVATAIMTQTMAITNFAYYNTNSTFTNSTNWGGSQILNDSSSDLQVEGYNLSIGFDTTNGVIVILISTIALAVLLGITVVGSGLADKSVEIAWKSIAYFSLWTMISLLGTEGLFSIPFFGAMTFFIMTLFYTLGVYGEVGSGSGGRG